MAGRKRENAKNPTEPSDGFLIKSMLGGDEAALRTLMARYDRLVRYTIFKLSAKWAAADPQWIDSIAATVWTGFIESMRRQGGQSPDSVPAFLSQTARNQTISAIRRVSNPREAASSLESVDAVPRDDPKVVDQGKLLSDLEELEALHESLAALESGDQLMLAQLSAITERRWQDAAAALGWSESTLRSRWKQALERLKTLMNRKLGR